MDNNLPLISVIVPVYKVEEYLARCIESVLDQTYKNLEIILVDDGSPDNCGKICDEYAEKDSRIKVIHKENGGVSSARNAALEIATGDYIGFVDSDDSLHPDMYEELYTNITKTDSDISVCSFVKTYLPDEAHNNASKNQKLPDENTLLVLSAKEAICDMMFLRHFGGHLWTKLFKADVIKGVVFDPDVFVCEDLLFCSEAILKSTKTVFSGRRLYNYLQRPTSALHQAFDDKYFTYYTAHAKIIEIAKKTSLYSDIEAHLQAAATLCCVFMAHTLLNNKDAAKKYAPNVTRCIKRHINKKSLSVILPSHRTQAHLLSIHFSLFSLFLKLHSIKKRFTKRQGGSYELQQSTDFRNSAGLQG